MATRKFKFTIEVASAEVGEGVIELDQQVVDEGLSDEFKKNFYDLNDAEGVAAHIAQRMVQWDEKLSQIEGWLLPDEMAKLVDYPHGYDNFEFSAEEIVEA